MSLAPVLRDPALQRRDIDSRHVAQLFLLHVAVLAAAISTKLLLLLVTERECLVADVDDL